MGARWLARAEGLWSCPQSLPWLSWPLEEGVSRGFGAVAGSVRPTVAGRADVGIGTGPLESALPLIPRDAYARPLSSARIAGAIPRGVLGRLVAAGGSDCVIRGGPLSEARVARVPALWQCLGWLLQGGQCTLTGGVVEFLAVVAGEAGIVSLVRHNCEQGRVQHVPRCGGARVVLAKYAIILQPACTPMLVPLPDHEAHVCHHVPGALRVLLRDDSCVCGEA